MFKLFVWKICYRGGQRGSKNHFFDRGHLCITLQVSISWNFNKIRPIPPKSKLLLYSFFGCQHKIQRWMLNMMKHKMMMIYHHILISLNFFHSFVQKHKKIIQKKKNSFLLLFNFFLSQIFCLSIQNIFFVLHSFPFVSLFTHEQISEFLYSSRGFVLEVLYVQV